MIATNLTKAPGGEMFIGAGEEYFLGSSSSPDAVVVMAVANGIVQYKRLDTPQVSYQLDERIFRSQAYGGCNTWLKSAYAKHQKESAAKIKLLLCGKPSSKPLTQWNMCQDCKLAYDPQNCRICSDDERR